MTLCLAVNTYNGLNSFDTFDVNHHVWAGCTKAGYAIHWNNYINK